ncbi:N-acetylmuramoyl-L-alanine amidase [Marinicrinis sediminis]|uniref:N-acetylmuramoyl-L-alanine amidase n=1 Tax=Marinicrinis sediminis TaxID=1652465 RepID=A0ABW5R6W4_9BACL
MKLKLTTLLLSLIVLLGSSLESLYAATVVIDPGHGGRDPGAIGINGLYEKEVNLSISKMVAEELQRRGYDIIMTRDHDKYLSLQDRVSFTNKQKADIFVSIHANAFHSSSLKGTMVLYYDDNYPQASYPASWEMRQLTPKSKMLAQSVLSEAVSQTNMVNKGLIPSAVYVVRMGKIPSILVETGFLSNMQDATRLADPSFRKKMALAIVDGIESYMPLSFRDLRGHWATDSILRLKDEGYVNGVAENIFQPNRAMTRAEFMAFMDRVFHFASKSTVTVASAETKKSAETEGSSVDSAPSAEEVQTDKQDGTETKQHTDSPANETDNSEDGTGQSEGETDEAPPVPDTPVEEPESMSYRDLTESHWAYKILEKAVDSKYINGYPDGTIRPNDPISRAEVSVIFNRIWEDGKSNLSSSLHSYVDVPQHKWYAQAIYLMQAAAILNGKTINEFKPLDHMTRAEATVMLDRYLLQYQKN